MFELDFIIPHQLNRHTNQRFKYLQADVFKPHFEATKHRRCSPGAQKCRDSVFLIFAGYCGYLTRPKRFSLAHSFDQGKIW